MKVVGFSFVRNAIKYDYPFLESVSSILPICDEFVIAVGKSEDDTLERLDSLGSPKIKIIETVWDDSRRTGGEVLAQQTNIALSHVKGDWAFYLQADEVVHEDDLPTILEAMNTHHTDNRVEGLLFSFNHFYGSYQYVGASRRWYRKEIRVVKTGTGVRSWGDAQGFRIGERKLHVKPVDATIYHYGWVKSPEKQQAKQRSFNKLWHPDEWVERYVGRSATYDYANSGRLLLFTGTHPAVMRERVASQNWKFDYDRARKREPFKERALDLIENLTGTRIGEYKNYEVIRD